MNGENLPGIDVDEQAETVTFHTSTQCAFQYHSGDVVGDSYRLLNLIGQGGMGVVYRAKHIIIDQDYALKLLAPGQINDQTWRRFEVEGRALARLKHENIVTIYNMGVDRKQCPFYVMDCLAGISLSDRISGSGAVNLLEALPIFLQICAGLDCAHRNSIIHRDIKPANIMLVPTTKGTVIVKIVDFGMARLSTREGLNNQALTASGDIFGSPLYMSPEQTLGQSMGARSDIYSLGCTLFETLTGRVPFCGQSAFETMMMHQELLPPALSPASENLFDEGIEEVVAKCLRKNADHRYQTISELASDLQEIWQELNQNQHSDSNNRSADSGYNSSGSQSKSQSSSKSDSAGEQSNSRWQSRSAPVLLIATLLVTGIATALTLISSTCQSQIKP